MGTVLEDRVARLRAILADARVRGLPGSAPDAEGLAETLQQMRTVRRAIGALPADAPYPLRRKHLLARIAVKLKHYGFAEEVQAYVTSCGHESVYALDVDELTELCGWLTQRIEDAQCGHDWPDAPAAR